MGLAAILYDRLDRPERYSAPKPGHTLHSLHPESNPRYPDDRFQGRAKQGEWLVRNGAYAIVGLVAVALAIWVWRSANATNSDRRAVLVNRTLVAFYEIIFVYLVIASLWFQPWYLLWLIALTVPLAAQHTYVVRTLLFCIGGVFNYFVWDYLWLWNHTDSAHNTNGLCPGCQYPGHNVYSLGVAEEDVGLILNFEFNCKPFNSHDP